MEPARGCGARPARCLGKGRQGWILPALTQTAAQLNP